MMQASAEPMRKKRSKPEREYSHERKRKKEDYSKQRERKRAWE